MKIELNFETKEITIKEPIPVKTLMKEFNSLFNFYELKEKQWTIISFKEPYPHDLCGIEYPGTNYTIFNPKDTNVSYDNTPNGTDPK